MIALLKRFRKIIYFCIVILIIYLFCYWQNNDIVITHITYHNDRIPDSFDGFTIVHISDLHNKSFGKHQKKLLDIIKNADPDIIVITGDLIDRRHTNIPAAMDLIQGAVEIAPIYYVPGNHEASIINYDELRQQLVEAGVNILDNTKTDITDNGDTIELLGVDDPSFLPLDYFRNEENLNEKQVDNAIKSILVADNASNEDANNTKQLISEKLLVNSKESFQILLCHRPELLNVYAQNNMDLVFTGHAHGGQFRIPFIGGFVAPNQGFFPKYTSGTHKLDNTTMVVSRGLGNSTIPIRIFNRPELIVLTLNP